MKQFLATFFATLLAVLVAMGCALSYQRYDAAAQKKHELSVISTASLAESIISLRSSYERAGRDIPKDDIIFSNVLPTAARLREYAADRRTPAGDASRLLKHASTLEDMINEK